VFDPQASQIIRPAPSLRKISRKAQVDPDLSFVCVHRARRICLGHAAQPESLLQLQVRRHFTIPSVVPLLQPLVYAKRFVAVYSH
jgi:hypothetical protein